MPSAKEGVYIATYKKVIQFLLAGNIAEILVLFIATVLNWEPPILAVHILLINLATDSLPAIALGVDPADANIMHEPPVRSGTLFERGLIRRVILHGLFIAGSTMAIILSGRARPVIRRGLRWRSVSWPFQLFHSLNQRSNVNRSFTPRRITVRFSGR